MSTTKWDGGVIPSTAVNADNTVLVQAFTAIDMQTQFILTNFAYAVGTNSLRVSLNGGVQRVGTDYVETAPNVFTFTSALEADDIILAEGLIGSVSSQSAATSAANAAASATAAANYLAAIQALTPPSLPLGITNGGTGAITKLAAFNALSPLSTSGDILVYGGGNNLRLPTAADGSVLVTEAAQLGGQRYYPDRPQRTVEVGIDNTVTRADSGNMIVRSTLVTDTTATITLDLASNLYPGWRVWLVNGDTITPNQVSVLPVNVQLSGSNVFRDRNSNVFSLPVGGAVCIQSDGTKYFTVTSARSSRTYFKLRLQAATGTSLGVPAVGLNDRIMTTVVENTVGYNPIQSGVYIVLTRGTWQFRCTTMHSGAAATRLGLYDSSGPALLIAGMSSPPNNLINVMTGRISGSQKFVYFREYFSAAVGTLGLAISDGSNPEIYGECEFWKE